MKPDFNDIAAWIEKLPAAFRSGELRRLQIGKSVEGRPVFVLLLTDPGEPAENKQRIFVVAGQHGTEESGRAISMALVDFLISDDALASRILKDMEIAVAPCANPDGSIRDSYRNAADVDLAHTYALTGAAPSPEGMALEKYALDFSPELLVDIHGRAGGGMKECVWLIPPLPFAPDAVFLNEIARTAHHAGEAAGFPQTEWYFSGLARFSSREDGGNPNCIMLGDKLARTRKSLCIGMETIEKYYKEPQWRASGLARLKAILELGLRDQFAIGEAGFPNSLISGTRTYGIVAHGESRAEKRQNRIAMIEFISRNWCAVDRDADGLAGKAVLSVTCKTIDGPNPDRFALILRIIKPCKIISVEWNGQPLPIGTRHGYSIWEDGISVFVRASLSESFGGPPRSLCVNYDSPYLRQ